MGRLARLNQRYPGLVFLPMYVLVYMGHSVYQNFIPVYLDQVGFTAGQSGLLLALPPFAALLAQPAWGVAADRAKTKNRILTLLFLLASLAMVLHRLGTAFLYVAFAMSFYAFTQNPALPLTDAITLETTAPRGVRFGPIRFGGTIGFAAMAVICGQLSATNAQALFLVGAAVMAATTLYSLLLPKVPGAGQGKRVSPLRLLRDRRILRALAFALILGSSLGFYYSFFPTSLLHKGGTGTMLGVAMALAAVGEFPFLFFAHKFKQWLGIKGILALAGGVLTLRWFLYGVIDSPAALMILQLLHGWCYIVISVGLAEYVNSIVPDELKASGQMLINLTVVSLGRILGSLCGGWAMERFAPESIFLFLSGLCLVAVLVFLVTGRHAFDESVKSNP